MLLEQIKWEDDAEDILKKFKAYFDEEEQAFSSYNKQSKINFEYWRGHQVKLNDINSQYEYPIFENRILQSVETLVPIAKSRSPEPAIYVSGGTKEVAQDLENKLKDTLINRWRDVLQMPQKMTQIVRDDYLSYWGVLKFEYDKDLDDYNFSRRDPKNIWCRLTAKSIADSDVSIEKNELELYKLIEMFPDDEKILMEAYGTEEKGTKVEYFELWTDDFTINATGDWQFVFGKRRNPHWNWTTEDGVTEEEVSEYPYNFFKSPRKPYEELAGFRAGGKVRDDTSLVEQARELQDQLNRILRQIDVMSQDNGLDIFNSNVVTEKTVQKRMDRGPKAALLADIGPEQSLGNVALRLPPNRHLEDLRRQADDIRDALDNHFGTHATTRGERKGQETFGRSKLLVGADVSRGLPSMEALADFYQRIFDWNLQGMIVYWTTPHNVPVATGKDMLLSQEDLTYVPTKEDTETEVSPEGKEDTKELKVFDITMTVGQEAVIPRDKAEEAKTATDLYVGGKLDPKTAFERLGFSDPDEAAYRTILLNLDPAAYVKQVLDVELSLPEPQQAKQQGDDQEAIAAIDAIMAGQPPPPPQAPSPEGLQALNDFAGTPEFGELSPEQKQLFVDYMREYSNMLGGKTNA